MNKIKELTKEYIKSFDDKNIEAVLSLINDDFELKDPTNYIQGKAQCEIFLKSVFKNEIDFRALNIFVDGDHSIIHFEIIFNGETLNGADIIRWENNKISSLVAYL